MKTFLPLDTMTLHCDSASRHDFPRLARESGFSFNLYRGRVDWTKIGTIDVDKLVRERDLETLQDILSCVMACNLNSEYDLKVLDPNFIKIFQLAQLGADFLLYCRNYLDHCVTVMQEQLRVALQEIEHLRKLKQQNSEEISSLQKKLKAKAKPTRSSNNSPVPIFKCSGCEKVFVGEKYLEAHQHRRHPELSNSAPFLSNQNREVDNLQQQVCDLQDRLRATEEALKQNRESFIPDAAVLQAMLQSELQKIKPPTTQSTLVEVVSSDISPLHQNQSANLIKSDLSVKPQQVDKTQAGSQGTDVRYMSGSSEQEKPKPESSQSVSLIWVEQHNDEIKALKEQLQLQNQAHEYVMQRKLEELQRQHRADLEDLRLSIMKSRGSGDHVFAPYSTANDVSILDLPQSSSSQGAIQAWDQPVNKTVKGSEGEASTTVNKDTVVNPKSPAVISSVEKPMSVKSKEENVVQEEYVSPVDLESSDSSSQTPSPHPDVKTKTKHEEQSAGVVSFNITKNVDAPEHSKSMYRNSSSSSSGSTSDTGSSSYDSESQSSNTVQESSPKDGESRAVELTPQVLNGLKEDLLGLLNRRLRELGVDPEWNELPVASFHSNMATVKHHQNIAAKSQNNYFIIQEALMKEVDKRVAQRFKLQQSTPSLSRTKENRAAGSFSIFARIKSHVKSKLSPSGQSSRISKSPQISAAKLKTGDLVENVYSQEPSTSGFKSSHEYEILQKQAMESDIPEPSSSHTMSKRDDEIEYSHKPDPTSSSKPVTVSAQITNDSSGLKTKPISSGPSATDVIVYSRSMYANLNRSDIEVEKRDSVSDSSTKQPLQLKTSTPIKQNSEVSSKSGAGKPTFMSSDIESISEVECNWNDTVENSSEKLTSTVKTRPHTTLTTAELLANVAKFRQNSGQLNSTQSIVKSNLKSSLSTGNIMKKKVMFRDEKDGFNTIELGPAQISYESLAPHRSHSENSLVMTPSSPLNSEQPVPRPRSSLMPTTVSAALTNAANTDSDVDWDWDRDSSDTLTVKKTEHERPASSSGGLSLGDTNRSGISFGSISKSEKHGSGDENKVTDIVKDIERKLQNQKNKPVFGISTAGPKSSELPTRPFSSLGNYPSASTASYSFGSLQEDKLSDLLLDDISSS